MARQVIAQSSLIFKAPVSSFIRSLGFISPKRLKNVCGYYFPALRVSRHRSMVTLDTQFQTPGTKRLQNISGSFSLSSYIFIHNWFNTKECSLVLFAALTIYSEKQNKKRLRFVDKFSGTFLQIPHTSDIYLSFFDSLHSLWQSLEPR